MSVMLVLSNTYGAAPLIHWASQLAVERSQPLAIVCCHQEGANPPAGPVSFGIPPRSEIEAIVEKVVGDRYQHAITIESIDHVNPGPAVLERADAQGSQSIIIGIQDTGIDERLARQLFHVPQYETILLSPGRYEKTESKRILVPMAGTFAPPALRLALNLAGPENVIAPFLVNPEFGVDSRAVARQELKRKLDALKLPSSKRIVPQVGIAGHAAEGIARAAADCQLIVLGGNNPEILDRIKRLIKENAPYSEGAIPTIALVHPKAASDQKVWRRIAGKVLKPIPRLGPTERINLFDRLQPGVDVNIDFMFMMGLSTSIAALGLLSNSTAAVIGAMLVAPLMTPLIGAGFGLIQGNARLFARAMKSMIVGVLVGLLFAVGIGLLTPTDRMTMELIARSQPDLLDFAVALLSGAAAAYAFARPGISGTLAGVAIAAALVPPLATVGIALTRGMVFVASGAALLHVTNLVAITLGAALVFYLLGVHGTRAQIAPLLWTRRVTVVLVVAALGLLCFLGYQTPLKNIRGQVRPLAFPVSEKVYQAVKERADQEGLKLIMAARSGFIERYNEIGFLLSSDHPVAPQFNRDLRQILKGMLDAETKVHTYILRNADFEESE